MIAYVGRRQRAYGPAGAPREQCDLTGFDGQIIGTAICTNHPWGFRGNPNNRLITWRGLIDGRACYGRLTENQTCTNVHFYPTRKGRHA